MCLGIKQPEFAHPHEVLSPHVEVTVASPTGTSVVDPISVDLFKDDAYCLEFYTTKKDLWTTMEKLNSFLGRAKEFDVIFVVGGFDRKPSFTQPMVISANDDHTMMTDVCVGP